MEKLSNKNISRKKTGYTDIRETNLQPPRILSQPKIISWVPVISKPILLEKSGKHLDHVDIITRPIAKQVILEITPDHGEQVASTEHWSTRPKS